MINKLAVLKYGKQEEIPKVRESSKIAVIFSGHLRAFEKSVKTIKNNLLSGMDADFYCHTWDKLEVDLTKENINSSIFINADTETKTNLLRRSYNIKSIQVDKYSDLHNLLVNYGNQANINPVDKRGFHGGSLTHYLYMLYSWKKSFQLLESSGNSYDLIIKCRPDLVFPDKIVLPEIAKLHTVYTPNIAAYYYNGFNDQLIFGDHSGIKYFCYIYDKVLDYIRSRVINPLRPETLLNYHMRNSSINIEIRMLRYYILRTSGTVLYPKPNDQNMHSGPFSMLNGLI